MPALCRQRPALRASGPRVWASAVIPDLGPLSRRAPRLAGDIAFRHFSEPHRSERREAGHTFLVQRARRFLAMARSEAVPSVNGPIPVHIFEPEGSLPRATVLVAHGWTAEASFMTLFGERLRHMGYRAILMDAPAHGHSRLNRASLVDYTQSVLAVADHFAPIPFVIAHSMGCLAALHAGGGGAPFHRKAAFERYALIAAPNRLSVITREFADARHLTAAARVAFERRLERIAHRPLATFTSADLLAATGHPALLVHARDDFEVPITHAEEIAARCPTATILPFDGLGHRKILSAPQVVRAVVGFLQQT